MKRNFFLGIVVMFFFNFSSCKKVDFETNSTINIRLTDAPFDAQEVNVEITDVLVKVENDNAGWRSLQVSAGVYNLLALQNGKDTLLASGSIHATSIIKELRFVLGINNTIKIDGSSFPLVMPTGADAGLVVEVDQKLNKDVHTFIIDFDAGQSVFQNTNGYLLKPALRLK
jgi:hypothetical protein